MAGHDLSQDSGNFTCTPYTYDDLVRDEAKYARALFKALDFIELP